jgi:hypothetical protein
MNLIDVKSYFDELKHENKQKIYQA